MLLLSHQPPRVNVMRPKLVILLSVLILISCSSEELAQTGPNGSWWVGGDDGGAKVFPIAVADPAMVLTAGIDDVCHRRIGHRLDRFMQRSGALVAAAGVDQNGALGCDDKAESCIVSKVFRVALFMRADNGESAGGDFGQRKGGALDGKHKGQKSGQRKQDAGHGGLRNVARP